MEAVEGGQELRRVRSPEAPKITSAVGSVITRTLHRMSAELLSHRGEELRRIALLLAARE